MGETRYVATRRPRCPRSGCEERETRIDGYCSVYCRDIAALETELATVKRCMNRMARDAVVQAVELAEAKAKQRQMTISWDDHERVCTDRDRLWEAIRTHLREGEPGDRVALAAALPKEKKDGVQGSTEQRGAEGADG